jgi:N4-gp56 family major capsid protein
MATYTIPSSDNLARKAWSERQMVDITTDTEIVSEAIKDNILVKETDLEKGRGDRVRVMFSQRINDRGFIGDASVTGNERIPTNYTDDVEINQLRQVVQIPNDKTISQQRVVFDMPEQVYRTLSQYIQERMVVGTMNQLGGNNASSITYDGVTFSTATQLLEITGMNVATAPSTGQQIWAGGNTSDANVNADTGAKFNLGLIDSAEAIAMKTRPYIHKLNKNGVQYRCYLHVDGFTQLLQDVNNPIQYRDIYLNKIASGKGNELIDTRVQYKQTEIVVTDKAPNGVNSTTTQANVRRAVFVGQEAGIIAFGQGYAAEGTKTPGFFFRDDKVEVEQFRRIAVNAIYGITKATFNSIDRGTIAISHYVA